MKTYRYRAECATDCELLNMLLASVANTLELTVQHVYKPLHADLPDVLGTLACNLSLSNLRALMASIPDGHVMAETVQPLAKYTGERN